MLKFFVFFRGSIISTAPTNTNLSCIAALLELFFDRVCIINTAKLCCPVLHRCLHACNCTRINDVCASVWAHSVSSTGVWKTATSQAAGGDEDL